MEIKLSITGLDALAESLAMLGSAIAYDKGKSCCRSHPQELKAEPEAEKTEEEKQEKSPKISRDELRKEFHRLNSTENRTKLKDILNKYDAVNISSIDESDFESVLADLRALQ